MRRIIFAGVCIAIGWLLSGVGNFSLNGCSSIQERLEELQIAFSASLMATAKHPPVNLTMLAFEPLGEEIRIVLPDAVGAVVHGRVRLFLLENADAYTATAGEGTRLGMAGKSEPVTIYHAIGLGDGMLEELAGMILANSQPAALYVRLSDGTTGRFTRVAWKAR